MPESNGPQEVAISIKDMARAVGLGRSRFHQLTQEGVFPAPCQCPKTGRRYYDYVGQLTCLEVRRTNLGINGRTILFYARRIGRPEHQTTKARARSTPSITSSSAPKKKADPPAASKPNHAALLEGLRQLGVNDLTDQAVSKAISEAFPNGADKQPHEVVLIGVFRHLSRRNASDMQP